MEKDDIYFLPAAYHLSIALLNMILFIWIVFYDRLNTASKQHEQHPTPHIGTDGRGGGNPIFLFRSKMVLLHNQTLKWNHRED
jgi:hypothetical protein